MLLVLLAVLLAVILQKLEWISTGRDMLRNYKRSLITKEEMKQLLIQEWRRNFGPENSDLEEKHLEIASWAMAIKGKRVFSQRDEDGVIEAVFERIGTTDKVYVEFGVEDGSECNSRNLRENHGWEVEKSLLMDGSHHRPEINLQKVVFNRDNILSLFEKFGVPKKFDFLSEDSDAYDFFLMETILEGGYHPRAIMMEYNSNFELDEAKSILPPSDGKSWEWWDYTTYQGCSLLALKFLMERFNYSLVWCNKVNCMAVADAELGAPLRLPIELLEAGRLDEHWCDKKHRHMAVIGEDGKWNGGADEGEGSPHIRCRPIKQRLVDFVTFS